MYTGDSSGRILRIDVEKHTVEVFAVVGGRPLGMTFDRDQNLIVANHGVDRQPERDIAGEGAIYFSDSSSKYNTTILGDSPSHSIYDFLEGRPLGQLLRHDPATKQTTILLADLYFPNGITLTTDQQAVLVMESTRYRITKYNLATGAHQTFLDNVPGILDGFARDDQGHLLATMYDRTASLDRYVLPNSLARQAVARIPLTYLTNPDDPLDGSILALTDDATIVGQVAHIPSAPSNVRAHRGEWLLGSLNG